LRLREIKLHHKYKRVQSHHFSASSLIDFMNEI